MERFPAPFAAQKKSGENRFFIALFVFLSQTPFRTKKDCVPNDCSFRTQSLLSVVGRDGFEPS